MNSILCTCVPFHKGLNGPKVYKLPAPRSMACTVVKEDARFPHSMQCVDCEDSSYPTYKQLIDCLLYWMDSWSSRSADSWQVHQHRLLGWFLCKFQAFNFLSCDHWLVSDLLLRMKFLQWSKGHPIIPMCVFKAFCFLFIKRCSFRRNGHTAQCTINTAFFLFLPKAD